MSELVFFNDGLIPADQARVSIFDGGLLHGVGLFETMRSYGGRVFRLEDHLDRLYSSAGELGINIVQKRDELGGWIEVLLEANGLQDARLRLTLTRGSIKNTDADNPGQNVMFITAGAMSGYPPEYYQKGMTVIVSDFKQNQHDFTLKHKTTNYLGRLLALKQAQLK
jgi:branched-chain amino acid aminotransferase